MKITVFDGNDGDCLLLTGANGETVLFDGGRKGTFRDNATAKLGSIPKIDLVCVSHIDNDHIQGVVELVDLRMEQARADFHDDHPDGNPHVKAPRHRPPEIEAFWHNSFSSLVGPSAPAIGAALVAQQQVFSSVFDDEGRLLSDPSATSKSLGIATAEIGRTNNLATGFLEGIELERKLGDKRVTETTNTGFPRNLVERPGGSDKTIPATAVGGVTLHVLSPTKSELNKFRKDWKDWVEDNQERIAALEAEIATSLGTASGTPRIVESAKRSSLTPQNLVSIVALVEEAGALALFTGDAHQQDILDGLEAGGWLDQAGADEVAAGHLDVVKVQHHGSPNNLDRDFAVRVTADHYVFCGNGSHGNPAQQVVDHIIDSRVAAAGSTKRALTAQACDPFHLWFTGHPDRTDSQSRKAHMGALLEHVAQRIAEHPKQIGATVLKKKSHTDLDPSTRVTVGKLRER